MTDSSADGLKFDELAIGWWASHRSDVKLDPVSSSDEEWDAYNDATDQVEALSLDLAVLPRLITALARATPTGQDAAFIATWVLEDANQTLPVPSIERALNDCDLTALEIETISRGWHRF